MANGALQIAVAASWLWGCCADFIPAALAGVWVVKYKGHGPGPGEQGRASSIGIFLKCGWLVLTTHSRDHHFFLRFRSRIHLPSVGQFSIDFVEKLLSEGECQPKLKVKKLNPKKNSKKNHKRLPETTSLIRIFPENSVLWHLLLSSWEANASTVSTEATVLVFDVKVKDQIQP